MRQFLPLVGIASSITFGYPATLTPATAQIVPDNTLRVNSRVTPGCTVCTINGGTIRGVNLFHTFSEFSVPTSTSPPGRLLLPMTLGSMPAPKDRGMQAV